MHVGARYYEVETGRWVQKDPWLGTIKNPQTLNSYTYVINNPIDFIDPSGRVIVGCLIIAIGIVVTIIFLVYIGLKKIKERLERQEKEAGVDVERVYEKQYQRRSVIK